ncbi:hypothetical protein ABK040_013569 [Willaertia magna]
MSTQIPLRSRLALGGFLITSGLTYGIVCWEPIYYGFKSKDWKTETVGTVIDLPYENYDPRDPNQLIIPAIEYEVKEKVNNNNHNEYTYRKIVNQIYSYQFFGIPKKDIKKYIGITNYLKPGMKVKIKYDPNNPTKSVVVPGLNFAILQPIAFSLGSLFIGSTILLSKNISFTKKNIGKLSILTISSLMILGGIYAPIYAKKQMTIGNLEDRRKIWIYDHVIDHTPFHYKKQ